MSTCVYSYKPQELTEDEALLFENLSRRRFVTGAGALGLGVLTGCGAPSASTPAATSVTATYPRTVKHTRGDTVIKAPPTRLISLMTNFELDTLLALGIIPVLRGAYVGDGMRAWTRERGGDKVPLVEIAIGNTWNLETLAAAKPDLIVNNGYEADYHTMEMLGSVAPTLVLPVADVPNQLRVIAEACNIDSSNVDTILTDIEQTYASFKPPRMPKSIVYFTYYGGSNLIIWTNQGATSALLQRMGLPALTAPPVPASQERKDYVEVSLEQIVVLEADLLMAATYNDPDPAIVELESRPVFQNLNVVASGKYRRLTPDESHSLTRVSALTPPYTVQTMQRVLQP